MERWSLRRPYEFFDVSKFNHYCFIDGISHYDSYRCLWKLWFHPASYTLASHVPIFLAMFLSRKMAACVVIGSTLGFFVAGFPIVIVMRAASHIIFALMGLTILNIIQCVLTGLYPLLRLTLLVLYRSLLVRYWHAYCSILQLRCQTLILPIYVVFVLGGGTIVHSFCWWIYCIIYL